MRFHIIRDPKVDALQEVYNHRVYKELIAQSQISSEYIVRYFSSWFETLDETEREEEKIYRNKYLERLEAKRQKQCSKKKHKHDKASDADKNVDLTTPMLSSAKQSLSFRKTGQKSAKMLSIKSIYHQTDKNAVIHEVDNEDEEKELVLNFGAKQEDFLDWHEVPNDRRNKSKSFSSERNGLSGSKESEPKSGS